MRRATILSTAILAGAGTLACDQAAGHTDFEVDGGTGAAHPDGAPGTGGTGSNEGNSMGSPAAGRVTVPDGGAEPVSGPPPVTQGGAPCILSADCGSGLYCDLGECYQACNVDTPCRSGQACSPRGRCLDDGGPDRDPAPVVASAGTVRGDPSTVELTERDDVLRLHLIADSKNVVRYRVEVSAPYLSIAEPRGSFQEETTITLPVDASAVAGRDLSGSVRVVTNLGDVMFTVPIRVGVTGAYLGTLTYGGSMGGPQIGTSHLGVDIVEKKGNVAIRFVPERSLLFPSFDGKTSVTGRGSFSHGEGLDAALRQVVPAGFAGDDDWFQRPIGRDIHLDLSVGDRGALDGTFTETIYGLMVEPIVLDGHAHFERMRCAAGAADCEPRADPDAVGPELPELDSSVEPQIGDVFPGWQLDGCKSDPMENLDVTIHNTSFMDYVNYHAFAERLSGTSPLTGSDPLGDLAAICENELQLTAPLMGMQCSQVAPIACAASVLVAAKTGTDGFDTFGSLYAHTLEAPLFVAQNDVVRALKESFLHGPRGELDLLDHAKSMLRGPATWVLQASMLEFLRGANPGFHKGKTEAPTWHAGSTLSRLMLTRSTIDAELGRIDASARTGSDEERRLAAQKQGIQALLEAATLYAIRSEWNDKAPPELGTTFVDVVTPRDAGFMAIAQGSRVLGVPDGVVPMAYESGREKTNFEQLLKAASSRVDAAKVVEDAFITHGREFEDDEEHLATELEQVASGYENQVFGACGNDFDLDEADWASCGHNDRGTVGSKLLDIRQALARMQSAQGRIENKQAAISIELERIAAVKNARVKTIEFTSKTGRSLQVIDREEAQLNGMSEALSIASQASLWNGGAPLAEAVGAFAIQIAKGEVEANRQEVLTLQDMQVQEGNLEVEQIDSAATVKGLLVEMAQARLEAQEDVIGILSARADAENALADAKRALLLRARSLQRIGKSTLRDPTARLLQTRAALNALNARADAQTSLLQAGRGLEYHLNHPIGDALGDAVLNGYSAAQQQQLIACMQGIFDQSQIAFPKTQAYVTEVSVRERFGIKGSRKDEVTGEVLTAGAQFRRLLLRNENLDGHGGVGVDLSTTLDPGNGLWASNVCDDRITQIEAQLVGDFLGDNDAQVFVDLQGGGVLRRCDGDGVVGWSTSGHAVIQAGVNSFGSAPLNESLHGLSVASSKWRVMIPGASEAPANGDLDLAKVEDIVLRIHHEARPIPVSPQPVAFDCLGGIGGG
jgi:hypothetical protein